MVVTIGSKPLSSIIKLVEATPMNRYANLIGISIAFILLAVPHTAYGNKYGTGTYGSCQYSSCSITLSSNGTVTANVTPINSSSVCSVASDTVSVTTGSSTGYTVSLVDADTSNQMTDGASHSLSAVAATATSPTSLTANSWGYRIDGLAGFGAGPTSNTTNTATPALTFAAIPLSSATPDTIITSSVAASTAATTNVWYGVCTNIALPSGTYSDGIVYTALTQ